MTSRHIPAGRDGWEGLEAGRELDALVAERVMGWRRLPEYGWESPSGGFTVGAPEYSTDIAAAWEVVGKMRADGFATAHISCGCDKEGNPIPGWYASFSGTPAVDSKTAHARADTMPLAVTLAALKLRTPHPEQPKYNSSNETVP